MSDNNRLQLDLRRDAKIIPISAIGTNLAEAMRDSVIKSYEAGARVETPKYKMGGTLGYDSDITVTVMNPDDPKVVYSPTMWDSGLGTMQYILEVTHGIHNHWKKSPEHPTRWGYTYNERFVDQIPFVLQRIKYEWNEKKEQWGEGIGRISGRDYQFTIWRPGEDIILEQEDPPCLQRCNLKFLLNNKGEVVMNMLSDWRSRDHYKAQNSNNIAFLRLMELLAMKTSDMLRVPIKLGSYVDHSTSLHLYGDYFDKENLGRTLETIKKHPYEKFARTLDEFLESESGKDSTGLKRIIAAQMDAESKGHGLNQPESRLKDLGYDTANFPYPAEWDSWPKSWDAEPDASKLARVYKNDEILRESGKILGMSVEDLKIASDMYHKAPDKSNWWLHHEHFMKDDNDPDEIMR